MAVTVKVEGLAELERALKALPDEIVRNKTLMRALHDGARVIRDEAKRRAPVLQQPTPRREAGALRSGIVEHASRRENYAVEVRVRSRGYIFGAGPDSRRNATRSSRAGNPNYWWLVEFGTSKAAARPFLRPAFELKKREALEVITASLRRGIEAAARQLYRRAA